MNNILSFQKNLVYRRWVSSKPRYILLAIHGIGAHSERWRFLGEYLLKHNISTYALELRGCGDNRLPCPVYSFRQYRQDITACLRLLHKNHSKTRIILVGESMGGLIAFDYAIRHSGCDGLICISPAFQSLLKFRWPEYMLFPLLFIFPRLKLRLHFSADGCTQDKKVRKQLKNDPREIRAASGGLLLAILFSQCGCARLAARLKIPVLFQLAGQDSLVATPKSRQIFQRLRTPKKMLIYPQARHALSIEKNRGQVFNDLRVWLEKLK
ncbi:MAG: lysophospholipase [Candidatus Margulisbacteria bacterium]|jgi:alpha-beta hydrolase superfamily lysophospholipase|nr:lysophospholipase [Candidatus Margulisiibacteriota bacterium]